MHTYIVLLAPLTLVLVEKAIYEATSVKQSYCECKTLFSAKFIESELDPCVTISSSQVGMDAGLRISPLFLFLFFNIRKYYFYTSLLTWLLPFLFLHHE